MENVTRQGVSFSAKFSHRATIDPIEGVVNSGSFNASLHVELSDRNWRALRTFGRNFIINLANLSQNVARNLKKINR